VSIISAFLCSVHIASPTIIPSFTAWAKYGIRIASILRVYLPPIAMGLVYCATPLCISRYNPIHMKRTLHTCRLSRALPSLRVASRSPNRIIDIEGLKQLLVRNGDRFVRRASSGDRLVHLPTEGFFCRKCKSTLRPSTPRFAASAL